MGLVALDSLQAGDRPKGGKVGKVGKSVRIECNSTSSLKNVQTRSSMDVQNLIGVVEQKLLLRPLSPIERLVLWQSWQGQTYAAIARDSAYGSDYIKEVGARLWQDLSATLQERVTKKNLHLILEQHLPQTAPPAPVLDPNPAINALDFLGGPLPAHSPLYIERSPIEARVYEEIEQSPCAIRIKSSQKTGKSSFLIRLLDHAQNRGYHCIQINFQEADLVIFESTDRLLRWFCANTSRQLNLESRLDEYWQTDVLGSKLSCRLYFEQYLLPTLKNPVLLVLNEVDCLFQYEQISQDFLPLLRSWYEKSIQSSLWQKLRFVLVYSTQIYQSLNLNQSPLNIGLVVQLPDFTLEQVQTLAERYGLTELTTENSPALLALYNYIGGHPYLVNMAFCHLSQNPLSWETLLENAATPAGIYSDHLRSHLFDLQANPKLAIAFETVIQAEQGVSLDAIAAFQLESMGLIRFEGDLALPRCQLYRQFFREHLKSKELKTTIAIAESPPPPLASVDELTGLGNRRQFDDYLKQIWQEQQGCNLPLSLIFGDLDYFKLFNRTRGRLAGDTCLQLVAKTLKSTIKEPQNLIARYGGEEFTILLPHTSLDAAVAIAHKIRDRVKSLGIVHDQTQISGLPDEMLTISIGVATVIPNKDILPETLIAQADCALYQAKRLGRDRVETRDSVDITEIDS